MRKTSIFFVFAFALLHSPGEAQAASPGFCDRYVAQAISFEAQNAAKSCKLEGPRWGSDRAGHARWCRESDQESVQKEMDERQFWINKCRQCVGYAGKAVAEGTDIRTKKCGYNEDDPMWSTDPEVHRGWCMGSSDEFDQQRDQGAGRRHVELQPVPHIRPRGLEDAKGHVGQGMRVRRHRSALVFGRRGALWLVHGQFRSTPQRRDENACVHDHF